MKHPTQLRAPSARQIIGWLVLVGLAAGGVFLLGRLLGRPAPGGGLATPAAEQRPGVRAQAAAETIRSGGLAVAYAAQPDPAQADQTAISFTLTDAASGQPAQPAAPPAVWIGRRAAGGGPGQPACADLVQLYARGSLDERPAIDLNAYYILALNSDASISVIDPLGGVAGISQLYALVTLASPGEDWALSADARRLFVTMPAAGQVAVIDTESFKLLQNIDVGLNPVHIALQPDGRYLWVGNDSTARTAGGVTVIDTASLAVVAQRATGPGERALAVMGGPHAHAADAAGFDPPGYAFVANSTAGSLVVFDTKRLERRAELALGIHPTSLAYSGERKAIYAASASEGTIVVIDALEHTVIERIELGAGVAALGFAPDGRWGFAASPDGNRVAVIDARTNRVAHTLAIDGAPDQIAFTEGFAYIHLARRPEVALFDLAQLARPERPATVTVVGGQAAPDQAPAALAAAAIVPVHEHGSHVLITNPGDQSIYYYMEGMNAPMGSFQNYRRTPRAVRVIDRSIREQAPGVYAASVRLPAPGEYHVAFLLGEPRIIHCFALRTAPAGAPAGGGVALRFLDAASTAQPGAPFTLKFTLADAGSGAALAELADAVVVAALPSGQRSERFRAQALGAGAYQAELTLTTPGVYTLYVTIPSHQVGFGDLPTLTVRVAP